MDAALFAKMLSDKNVLDLKKLHYKYPQADLAEFIALLRDGFYKAVPLPGLGSSDAVYLPGAAQVRLSAAKLLLTPQNGEPPYGVKAMEDEILSTFRIEHIDTGRDSVRRVLAGYAPADESEGRIYGMKKGLEFIADPANRISEENLHHLYRVAVGNTLPEDDRLQGGARRASLAGAAPPHGGAGGLCAAAVRNERSAEGRDPALLSCLAAPLF